MKRITLGEPVSLLILFQSSSCSCTHFRECLNSPAPIWYNRVEGQDIKPQVPAFLEVDTATSAIETPSSATRMIMRAVR
jgi:hypothetical protein